MKQSGRRIRGIWIADVAHHGQSGILNERILGNDPSWWDHARDLLFLINKYQDQMPSPLIGIGHSMGGMQLAHLSLIHPSLFQALILIDPVIQRWNPGKNFALLSTYRRDIWPSRSQAAMKFMSSPFFQRWDPRVLERWIEYGLRELPTEIYPEPVQTDEKPVTLTTTKAQEVFTFLRPAYRDDKRLGEDCTPKTEMYPEDIEDDPFYRPEAPRLFRRLPELRPSVMYLFGQNSELSTPEDRQLKMDLTGTGPGGSGGAINGRVQQTALPCGHLIPMEMVTESAKVCTSFIDQELCRWEMQMKRNQQQWEKYSRHDRLTIDERWKENIGQPAGRSTRARDPKT